MSFVPIYTTHSPHIYFAFILHPFMSSLVISALTKALGWARKSWSCWPVISLTHVIYAVEQRVCVPTCFSHIQNTVVDVKRCRFSSSFERLWLILVLLNNLYSLLFGSESEVSKSGLRYFLCLSWNVAQHTRVFCSVWPFEGLCAETETLCVLTLHTVHFCQGPACLTLLWKTLVPTQLWPGNTYARGKADALSCLSL